MRRVLVILLLLLLTCRAYAQTSITSGLYLCPSNDGVMSVVNAQKAQQLSGCKPYNKTLLKTPTATTPQRETHIYQCTVHGKTEIVQDTSMPNRHCVDMGKTAASSTPAPALTEAVDDTTPSPDIYRCLDAKNRPSFVTAGQRDGYHDCQFFSRSFASARALLKAQAQGEDLPLAAPENAPEGLDCIGAGKITFAGQTHDYDCQTHSFNYTPGATAGSISYGSRKVAIAGHRFDYFAENGSCGGTITTPDGRTLHLAPTKQCSTAAINAARSIAANYLKTINIQVTGAFLARQQRLAAQINRIAQHIGVSPYLLHAVISAESAYRPRAVSPAGALGLMQLMPATAARFGVSNAFITSDNIRGGAQYLKWLLTHFNGDMRLAIAAYNAGEGNVAKYNNTIPPFIETMEYVPKVMQYYHRYRANPQLVGLK